MCSHAKKLRLSAPALILASPMPNRTQLSYIYKLNLIPIIIFFSNTIYDLSNSLKKGGLLSIVSIFLLVSGSIAQDTKKEYKQDIKNQEKGYTTAKIADSLLGRAASDGQYYFDFGNINKIPYYYNKGKLDKIKELQKKGEEFKLITELEDYIKYFGIENFSKDTDLLWMLAQLYEKNESIEKAKSAYRLVLKHHPSKTIEQIRQYFKKREHYDDLTELERDYFVPLEYYYELVEYRKLIDTLHPPRSILTNMGDLVNSRRVPDYAPSINVQDNFMIYTKQTLDLKAVGQNLSYTENLYFSKEYDGFWDEAELFPHPINSSCNEGSACLSRDGKTLFFARCRVEKNLLDCSDCMGSCDIYVSELDREGNWSKPLNLGANVNSTAWDSHPSLSATEDTLYFASDRPGGFGVSDLYFTFKIKKGEWAPAQNMGPIINTRGNEYSPYMNKKHNVFYFSSNGQLLNFDDINNTGKTRTIDIYKSYSHRGHWMEPKNVGPLVNGKGDESYFTIDSKSKNLYYARTEDNASNKKVTDLFAFPVPMEAQPTATITLKGSLVDSETGNPYEGIVSVIDLENGIEVAPKHVREDGTYEFDLINHANYLLIIQGDEFFRIEKLFTLTGDTTIASEATSVKNRKLRFTSIEFENGKWDILEEMEDDLWNVVNFLIDNPTFELVINGHTDSDGSPQGNLNLSQKRAEAIKHFISDNGHIAGERITAIGHGDTQPIRSPEVTNEDKRINRRVEFEIRNSYQNADEQFSDEDFEKNFENSSDDDSDW